MRRSAVVSWLLSVVIILVAVFGHFYESTSTGMLPVISYPLRPYAIPLAVIGILLAVTAMTLQRRKG